MTPAQLTAWMDEHYDLVESPLGLMPHLVCKRCRKRVGYVTKHAAVRHGDDVEVMPAMDLSLADAY
jgi:hypothetical protein